MSIMTTGNLTKRDKKTRDRQIKRVCDVLSHLMARPHPDLSLCGRQPLVVWIITKNTEEVIVLKLKLAGFVNIQVLMNSHVTPETHKTEKISALEVSKLS